MTIYTANLAADLTVSSPLKPINTLTDLAAQKDMEIRVLKGSSVWDVSEVIARLSLEWRIKCLLEQTKKDLALYSSHLL